MPLTPRGLAAPAGAPALCGGVNLDSLVPDESLTIEEGAVAPWNSLMWSLMVDVCREMGVRTNVPFRELTEQEKDIVYHGPAVKKHILYHNKGSGQVGELDFTYFNAIYTVENALAKVKDEKGMKRVEKFLMEGTCPDCHGTRLSEAARAPQAAGHLPRPGLRHVPFPAGTVGKSRAWLPARGDAPHGGEHLPVLPDGGPGGCWSWGWGTSAWTGPPLPCPPGSASGCSWLGRCANRTTGVLYVLDEPSIGLHPSNIVGLTRVMEDLVADGNSVLLVDHDTQILREADWILEMGPEAGANGGQVVAQGTVEELGRCPASQIGPFLTGEAQVLVRQRAAEKDMFQRGAIRLATGAIHTVKPLEVAIPQGRLTVVTGVSGSGKTTMVLESLIPGLEAATAGEKLPGHVREVDAPGIRRVKLIDATPIGINVRSTVATYAGVHDELRKVFARTPDAKEQGYKAGDFSYNTGKLRCPTCDGTGSISLDVQFLPDVDITCPECRGFPLREGGKAHQAPGEERPGVLPAPADGHGTSTPPLKACQELKLVRQRLQVLEDLGLGLPDVGRGHPGPVRRGGPAAEAGQRNGPRPGGHGVRLRRAHHRPAPPGRADASPGV